MNQEDKSDTECITHADYLSRDNIIAQSINEGLFITEKDIGNTTKEINEDYSFNPNSFKSSEVVYTFTFDCRFKCGSFDQIGSVSFKARARKSVSLGYIGISERASGKNCLYSSKGINSTNIARSLLNSLNFSSDMPVFPIISSKYLLISSSANSGEKNSKSWSTNKPLVNEFFQKNVNKTLVSTTNLIYTKPLFFNSLNLPLLEALCNLTDQSVISLSSSNCFTSLLTKIDMSTPDSFISLFNSSGISTFSSAISYSPDNYYEDVYLNLMEIETCSGKYEYCDPKVVDGTAKCSKYPKNFDVWLDYADTGVIVNKQPGDKLKLNIYSFDTTTLQVYYDTNFIEGNCNGIFNVAPGINTCELTIKDNIQDTIQPITVEGKIANVNIINNPQLLVITDSEKLLQQFQFEENGVKAVLKQAYASAKDYGVVYDLSWYKNELGVNNPFISFINYFEKIIKPNMVDNSYSIEVSNFIKNRCEDCKDVMIVGDDFVVPSYRREIPTLERKWFFWTEEDVKNIYTDIPYTKKSMLYLSEYKEIFKNTDIVAKEGKYEGKDVLFILPDSITTEQRTQVERLKKAFNDKGYKPDYSEMRGKDTFCLDERWFKNVTGRTLIIIGTEENNNAFKCMPFVFGDTNLDSAFMQPNVWDTDEYALVINTDNPKIIGALADMVETGNITQLKSESAYFFKVGVTYASYAALGVGIGSLILFTGGTAAPVAIIAASQALEFIADAGDVADTCVVNQEGVGWCGGTITLAALPFVPSKIAKVPLKKLADSELNQKLFKMFEPVDDLINKYFKKLRNKNVIGDEAFEAVTKTAHDNIYLAKGSQRLFKGSDDVENLINKKIRFEPDVPQKIKQYQRATYIKSVGKVQDQLDDLEDVGLRNKLNNRFEGLMNRVENTQDLTTSRATRGEIESLSHEKLGNLEEINRPFTDDEVKAIGNGQIDILRENGDIVETKFVKMKNLGDDLPEQIENFVKFQKYHGKDSAQIIIRQKTDLTIRSQSELSILIPEDVKSLLNNKVHLEIIDLEGNLWRFN